METSPFRLVSAFEVPFKFKLLLLAVLIQLSPFQEVSAQTRRKVLLDTKTDAEKESWVIKGNHSYFTEGNELQDPGILKLLPSTFSIDSVSDTEGFWLIFPTVPETPIIINGIDKSRRHNTVSFSYSNSSTSTLTSITSLGIEFQAGGDSSISIFSNDIKMHIDTKTLVSSLNWTLFKLPLKSASFVDIQFTAKREWDFILINLIWLDGISWTVDPGPPTEQTTETPETDPPAPETTIVHENEDGLLLVHFNRSMSLSNPVYLVAILVIMFVTQYNYCFASM